MFDGRIYRAAFVPLLLALAIAGFSPAGRPAGLSTTLAPDAFDGQRAFAQLRYMARAFPDRLPGGYGDRRLAGYVANAIAQAAGGAGGGFRVSTRSLTAATIDGRRTLQTVIAQRAGSTGEPPVVILAHRDAAKAGSAAQLSGTAALLELARVFALSETRRTIVLVSTSGGSGGQADAAALAGQLPSAPDAAIVLGDLAGATLRTPSVLGYCSCEGAAPDALVRTLDGAISQETGLSAGAPGLGAQLAHLAFPLSTGGQAPLNAAGIPAVLVQASGERGPAPRERVSQARLANFGRAVLSAVHALDEGPAVKRELGARLLIGRKLLPGWAVRLLALALLLPPLLACVDALARLRRRRHAVGRWVLWTLTCAVPVFAAALFARLLGLLGIAHAPRGALLAPAVAADGAAPATLAATLLVLALALASWPALARRLRLSPRPSEQGAGLAVMLVLLGLATVSWVVNPFACLLVLPAVHLWMPRCSGAARRRTLSLAAVAVSLAPLALLCAAYADALGLGPLAFARSGALLVAGGQVGVAGALLWSIALGCLLAVLLLRSSAAERPAGGSQEAPAIVTRGPLSYAGPGSLGGTESALRR